MPRRHCRIASFGKPLPMSLNLRWYPKAISALTGIPTRDLLSFSEALPRVGLLLTICGESYISSALRLGRDHWQMQCLHPANRVWGRGVRFGVARVMRVRVELTAAIVYALHSTARPLRRFSSGNAMLIELYDGLTSKRMRSVWLIARQRRDLNTPGPRPDIWIFPGSIRVPASGVRRLAEQASRRGRREIARGDAGFLQYFQLLVAGTLLLTRLVARCADGSRFQLIAATLDHLVSDLVDHFLDKQAQVTSTTEI